MQVEVSFVYVPIIDAMQLDEDKKNVIHQAVSTSSDANLNSPTLELNLYNRHKVIHPTLQIDQRRISFSEEVLYLHSAPLGMSITPGKAYAYALYIIPINGDSEVSHRIMRSVSNTDTFGISSDGLLFYKEFADNVDEDEEVQRRVAQNALVKINTAKLMFENLQNQTDTYNSTLEAFISQAVEEEKETREGAATSKRNLDPFV